MGETKERIAFLERKIDILTVRIEEDRKVVFDLVEKCTSLIDQLNARIDKHFDDTMALSDKVNLLEGSVEILGSDVSKLNDKLLWEEEPLIDEHETS